MNSAYEKKLLQKYPLTTVFGVTNLLHDIHDLRENRFKGTDTTFLSCVLIDFELVLRRVRFTERQQQILFLHYEMDLSQEEIATSLGISQQAVSKHLTNAIAKIVIVGKEDESKCGKTSS